MKHSVRGVLMAVFVLLAADGIARAQATAQLDGTVRDESGGVLPGVTVTVTQTDTGFIRSVVTETNGAYVLPNLPTGPTGWTSRCRDSGPTRRPASCCR